MSDEKQETTVDILREMRNLGKLDEKSIDEVPRTLLGLGMRTYADRLEAAHRREVDKLNSAIQATVGRSDAEIDRLRREIAELKRAGNAAQGRELSKNASKNGADFGQLGDVAKLREAAEKTRATLEEALQILNGISDEEAGRLNARLEDVADAICEVTQWIIPDALAAPATAEKSSAVGNAAAMREALEKIAHYADNEDAMDDPYCADGHILADIARLALATPPRNCDLFGTKDNAREEFQKLRCHRVWADVSLWDNRDEIEAFLDWLFATKKGGAE